jgi:hypothetical protein
VRRHVRLPMVGPQHFVDGDGAKKIFKEGRQVVLDLKAFSWKDGGRRRFSLNSQRPEAGEKRVDGVPAQGQRIMNEQLSPAQPSAYGQHRPAQSRKRRPRRIQMAEPSAQGGGVRHAIRVFDGGGGVFPATAFQEVAL